MPSLQISKTTHFALKLRDKSGPFQIFIAAFNVVLAEKRV